MKNGQNLFCFWVWFLIKGQKIVMHKITQCNTMFVLDKKILFNPKLSTLAHDLLCYGPKHFLQGHSDHCHQNLENSSFGPLKCFFQIWRNLFQAFPKIMGERGGTWRATSWIWEPGASGYGCYWCGAITIYVNAKLKLKLQSKIIIRSQ